ncbi:MAG TPA: 50S ribosomal protein L25 [Thermoanaerobaculaceae bacterium]|nr:50S ribosomal protein L25 [Thermoanaerobaculaceae bacterium]HRS15053.1 50S ribosomal protein L25 [Thermoanaerobaculaceae bacterium]
MEDLVIEVERRDSTGKGANRKLRKQGLIPAIVYGGGKEPAPVVVDRHTVTELLKTEKGRNSLFLLRLKGTSTERHAMLHAAQQDPITHQFLHLDFIRVDKGQRVKVEVRLVLDGEPVGVKAGGFLDWGCRSLHLECAAEAVPDAIHVDVSGLGIGAHILAGDLALPEGVKLLDDPHKVIVHIEAHGAKVEGEEAPGAPEEKAAEPEVIKRGKATAEEGGE